MKTLILYSSHHHKNTLKVAQVMAEVLDADIAKISEVKPNMIEEYDIIGFGSGIYYCRAHQSLLKFINSITSCDGKKAFVFSTSGVGVQIFNRSMIKPLKDKNLEILGSFACKGFDTYGPAKLIGGINKGRPNEKDLERAMDFAKKLAKRI